MLREINDEVCCRAAQLEEDPVENEGSGSLDDEDPYGGSMIVGSTYAPTDIAYPTDTGLLAEAIERTDRMIDELHAPHIWE